VLIAGAAGWAALLLMGALHLRTRRRLVLVARASHELRGPLCAARLGLDTLAAEPARVAAIDLELRRAARALDDLAAAPSGGRAPERRELVDLRALVALHAPAWRALAASHGAELRLESVIPAPRPEGRLLPLPAAPRRPPTAAFPTTAAALRPAAPASPLAPGAAAPRGPEPARPDRVARPAGDPSAPVRLRRDRPPPAAPATAVLADPVRIAQACANLVANAAEHGGGVVRVRVAAGADTVRLEVSDDGPGLPAPVSALVAAARTRRGRRGHGLGVAAAVAEEHGGRLAPAPASAGARLVLELPAAAPAVLSRRRAAAPPEIVA
jgi:signal transduction histidine kinase